MNKQSLYIIEFSMEEGSYSVHMNIRARNKVTAVIKAFSRMVGWRAKDRVTSITIKEDVGNTERTSEDYKKDVYLDELKKYSS